MGVMFDVIAALLALLSSTVMQTRVSVIDRILSNVATINPGQLTIFLHHLDFGRTNRQNSRFVRGVIGDISRPLLGRVIGTPQQPAGGQGDTNLFTAQTDHGFEPEANALQVIRSCGDIDSIRVLGDAAGASMLFGILSFMASIVCLSITTQPVAVWVPTVVACSCVVILPFVNRALAVNGFRKHVLYQTVSHLTRLMCFRIAKHFRCITPRVTGDLF